MMCAVCCVCVSCDEGPRRRHARPIRQRPSVRLRSDGAGPPSGRHDFDDAKAVRRREAVQGRLPRVLGFAAGAADDEDLRREE